MCLEVYELDPAHFISAPGLAWEAALKKTKVNTTGTRRSGDVPWKSPKCPNVQDLQGTVRELLGDQHKHWWFNEKTDFRCNSPWFCKSIIAFYWKNKYSKILNEDVHRTPARPSYGTSGGSIDGTFWDVRGTSIIHVFLNPARKHIKLTLTSYSRLYSGF